MEGLVRPSLNADRNMGAHLEFLSLSEQNTVALGVAIGRILGPGDVILLYGDLGSGKTRFAKGVVSAATGVPDDDVVSPTFTLINSFTGGLTVHHADLYRIEPNRTDDLGLEEAVDEGDALIVEWPDKADQWDENRLEITIGPLEQPNARRITFAWRPSSDWNARLSDLAATYEALKQE